MRILSLVLPFIVLVRANPTPDTDQFYDALDSFPTTSNTQVTIPIPSVPHPIWKEVQKYATKAIQQVAQQAVQVATIGVLQGIEKWWKGNNSTESNNVVAKNETEHDLIKNETKHGKINTTQNETKQISPSRPNVTCDSYEIENTKLNYVSLPSEANLLHFSLLEMVPLIFIYLF